MKVAYILPSLQEPSGWRSFVKGLIGAMRPYVETFIFTAVEDYPQAKSLFPADPVYPLPATQRYSASHPAGLERLLRCYRSLRRLDLPPIDLVHSLEAYPTGLVGHWLANILACPHILTAHGTYAVAWYSQPIDRWLYARVLRRARLVCPISQGTASLMQRYFSGALEAARLQIILNGNDFYTRVPRQQALERVFPATPTVLTVGDVKPRKGQHISLEAFARLKQRLPTVRYILIGRLASLRYYAALQRLIAERQIRDVEFLGAVSDETLCRHYQSASLFFLAPQQVGLHFEGFGLVYLEAGAYGLPVVATNTGGVPDAVQDGVTGLLTEPQDVEAMADALYRLLTDSELAIRIGRANRLWAESLSWERCAAEYQRAYQMALGAA